METNFDFKKVVVVGDSRTGKSALLMKFAKEMFLEEYLPTLFENYAVEIESNNNRLIQLAMYDTPGDDNYSHIRPLSYPETDFLLICFDLTSNISYQNIFTKWLPEIKEYCPNVPFFIVGCKKDLHSLNNHKVNAYTNNDITITPPTTLDEIQLLKERFGAKGYFECSSKTKQAVVEMFYNVVGEIIIREKLNQRRRSLRRPTITNSISYPSNSNDTITCTSIFRRRSNYQPKKKNQNRNSCIPLFKRKPVITETAYFPAQNNPHCVIL